MGYPAHVLVPGHRIAPDFRNKCTDECAASKLIECSEIVYWS